jgi:hypothetical protein
MQLNQLQCKRFFDLLDSLGEKVANCQTSCDFMEILKKFNWPYCLCDRDSLCQCEFIPEWVKIYASEHPTLKCLRIDFMTNLNASFKYGLQLLRKVVGGIDHNSEIPDFISKVIWMEPLSAGYDPSVQESVIQQASLLRDSQLQEVVTGYICGMVVYTTHRRWCKTRLPVFRKETERKYWLKNLEKCLLILDEHRTWISQKENETKFPLRYTVVRASLAWLSQWICYAVDDLKLVEQKGQVIADALFSSGSLIWSIGWIQTDAGICQTIMKIMEENLKCVILIYNNTTSKELRVSGDDGLKTVVS